jgi:uncharacterized membrane protein YqgA involved in biofilm formation
MILHSTVINALTIVIGSLAGFFLSKLFDKSRRFKKLPDALMKAISLCVIIIGIKGAIKDDVDFIIVLISLVVGTTIGSLIKINTLLNKFGDFVERKLVRKKKTEVKDPTAPVTATPAEGDEQKSFSKAFVATSLTCCVGAMAITGSLNAGMGIEHTTLYTKSLLDLITAFVYSSAFGIGATLAAVPVLIYQGIIAIGADALAPVLEASATEISAVGSVIVMGLGFNMLGATKIKVANMLPAVFLPIILCPLFNLF